MVRIDFADPDFVIWSPSAVTINYMLHYEEAELFVPVATLNMAINRQLAIHFEKKPALYHYRELLCRDYGIHRGHTDYASPDLRASLQAAIKIYVAFVRTKAYNGHQVCLFTILIS